MSDEPDQIIDYAELIKGNVRDLKSFSLDIQTERRAAFDAVLTRTENLLTVAQSKMWKELGFQLHDCKDPPARFFWDEARRARVCENCGHTRSATGTRLRPNASWRSASRRGGGGDGTGWMGN